MRAWPFVVFALGCAPHVGFRGVSRPPHAGELTVYERPPSRSHRVVGWLLTDGADPLWMHLQAVREEATRRGCDAVVWNPNHRLVDGVVSDDATGVYFGAQQVIGARAACIAWMPSL